jgi:photosystem II stability/assembly factor-like uncharacterized protein
MRRRVTPLPWALPLLCLSFALCQLIVGCRSTIPPQWEPASVGIRAQSDVILVGIAPHDPQTLLLATYEPGGLYRSQDAGLSWQSSNTGLEGVTVLAVARNPADDQCILAGTVSGGFKSTDGGENWASMPTLPATYVCALAWAPDGSAAFAGTQGLGVFVSLDDGLSWSSTGPEGAGVLSLAVAANGTIYAGTSGEGILLSVDGGVHWRAANEETKGTFVPILQATSSGTVWALADNLVYSSADAGQTWRQEGPKGFEARSLAVDRLASETIYIAGLDEGVAISQDEGGTWEILETDLPRTDFICLGVDPADPRTAYLGTRGSGLFKTTDGGRIWVPSSKGVGNTVVTALLQHPHRPQTLYAGTVHGVYNSIDSGQSWTLISGGEREMYVQALAVDSLDSEIIYAGTDSGVYVSRDSGESWSWASQALGNITIFCLTIDPKNHDTVYAGSWGNNVLRSIDAGTTWAPVHHGLETLSVYSFAVSPTDHQMLLAGTVEALYRSADGGESWRAVEGLREEITTFALLFDATDPSIVYAGTTDGVYRSIDEGKTWAARKEGMGEVTVNALATDPDSAAVYAGTEHRGLFRCNDADQIWTAWGLQGTSVYAVVIDQATGILWAATDEGVFRWQL